MLDLVTTYVDPLFSLVFGYKTGTMEGLMILSALSILSGLLSNFCLKVAVNIDRKERMMSKR